MKHGQYERCVELAAEVSRLTPYVEAFRREEARADKLGTEVDDLRDQLSAIAQRALRENQQSICAWTEATFGEASSNARVAARANEEMAELLRALTSDDDHPKAVEEAADVVIILYRLAHRMGCDLHAEIDRKMEINRKREWKVTNGHGYHVRDKAAALTSTDRCICQDQHRRGYCTEPGCPYALPSTERG